MSCKCSPVLVPTNRGPYTFFNNETPSCNGGEGGGTIELGRKIDVMFAENLPLEVGDTVEIAIEDESFPIYLNADSNSLICYGLMDYIYEGIYIEIDGVAEGACQFITIDEDEKVTAVETPEMQPLSHMVHVQSTLQSEGIILAIASSPLS